SLYSPQTGEVAAFEELVGSHGGLGGTQNRPFILYPKSLESGDLKGLVGAPSIYKKIGEWQHKVRTDSHIVTQLPATPPDIESGQRTRNLSILAVLMTVIGTWNLLVGASSLITSYAAPNTESVSHLLVPLLAAIMSVAIGVGLWRLKHWALEAAIAILAVSI